MIKVALFSAAGFISLISTILVAIVGLKKLTNAFGLICIFRGIGGIIGLPISGESVILYLGL